MSNDVKGLIVELGETINEHKGSIDDRLEEMNERLDSVENSKGRVGQTNTLDNSGSPKSAEVKAAGKFLKSGNASDLESKSLSTVVESDGGFTVVPALHSEILKRLIAGNPLREKVRFIPNVDSNSFEQLISVGGAQALRKAELSERNKTDGPELEKVEIKLTELSALPAVTSELLSSSSFDVVSWLGQEVADSFAEKERYEWLYGTGNDQPKGMLSYTLSTDKDADRAFGEIQKVPLNKTDDDAIHNSLTAAIYAMAAHYRPGSVWLMSTDAILTIRTLKDSAGRPLWNDGLSLGQPPTLMGYEVVEMADMPELAAGSISIAFVNLMRAYTAVENPSHAGVLRDELTQPGFVKFYTRVMTGAGLVDDRAIKVLETQ